MAYLGCPIPVMPLWFNPTIKIQILIEIKIVLSLPSQIIVSVSLKAICGIIIASYMNQGE
jgi:hypothetical protein